MRIPCSPAMCCTSGASPYEHVVSSTACRLPYNPAFQPFGHRWSNPNARMAPFGRSWAYHAIRSGGLTSVGVFSTTEYSKMPEPENHAVPGATNDSWRTWLMTGARRTRVDPRRMRGDNKGLKKMLV